MKFKTMAESEGFEKVEEEEFEELEEFEDEFEEIEKIEGSETVAENFEDTAEWKEFVDLVKLQHAPLVNELASIELVLKNYSKMAKNLWMQPVLECYAIHLLSRNPKLGEKLQGLLFKLFPSFPWETMFSEWATNHQAEENTENLMKFAVATFAAFGSLPIFFQEIQKEIKEKVQVSSPVRKEKQFRGPKDYQDSYHVSSLFNHVVKTQSKLYIDDPTTYYAPFIPIIQSSGYGKSRLVLEASKEFVVFFICLRKATDTSGEPTRTPVIADYLETHPGNQTMEFWHCFFISAMVVYMVEIKAPVLDLTHFRWLTDILFNVYAAKQFWSQVKKCCNTLYQFVVDQHLDRDDYQGLGETLFEYYTDFFHQQDDTIFNQKLDDVLNAMIAYQLKQSPPTAATTAAKQSSSPTVTKKPTGSIFKTLFPHEEVTMTCAHVLFAFDEAASLLVQRDNQNQIIVPFRRATRAVNTVTFPSMYVALDTNSKISNFASPDNAQKSGRVSSGQGILFPPFHSIPLELISVPNMEVIYIPFRLTDGIIRCVFDPVNLARKSRAIYAAKAYNLVNNVPLPDVSAEFIAKFQKAVVGLAKGKLVLDSSESKEDNLRSLALAACRFHLSSTIHEVKERLMNLYAATLLGISKDRRDIQVSYPSEPILAEASIALTIHDNKFLDMLTGLSKHVPHCLVESNGGKGELGELIASILLARAYDVTSQDQILPEELQFVKQIYTRPILLKEFVRTLLNVEIGGDLSHGIIQFNHFIKISYHISQEDLWFYFERSAALVCVNGETGIDIVIPVALPKMQDDRFHPIDYRNKDEFYLTAFAIQVKNWNNPYPFFNIISGMINSPLPLSIGFNNDSLPQLFMVLNVGAGTPTTYKDNYYTFYCHLSKTQMIGVKRADPLPSQAPNKKTQQSSSSSVCANNEPNPKKPAEDEKIEDVYTLSLQSSGGKRIDVIQGYRLSSFPFLQEGHIEALEKLRQNAAILNYQRDYLMNEIKWGEEKSETLLSHVEPGRIKPANA